MCSQLDDRVRSTVNQTQLDATRDALRCLRCLRVCQVRSAQRERRGGPCSKLRVRIRASDLTSALVVLVIVRPQLDQLTPIYLVLLMMACGAPMRYDRETDTILSCRTLVVRCRAARTASSPSIGPSRPSPCVLDPTFGASLLSTSTPLLSVFAHTR